MSNNLNDPINIKELLERVSGNKEFASRMMQSFFSSFDEKLSELKENAEQKDYTTLANNAHKLKGILGNLSITKGIQILVELEVLANDKNDSGIASKTAELEDEIGRAIRYYQDNIKDFF